MAEKNQISEKELLHKLLESNVLLQSKVVELVSSIKENNKQVSELVGFFKEAGEQMVAESEDEKLRPLFDKLESLLEQNKTIAKGLILLEKYIKTTSGMLESSRF